LLILARAWAVDNLIMVSSVRAVTGWVCVWYITSGTHNTQTHTFALSVPVVSCALNLAYSVLMTSQASRVSCGYGDNMTIDAHKYMTSSHVTITIPMSSFPQAGLSYSTKLHYTASPWLVLPHEYISSWIAWTALYLCIQKSRYAMWLHKRKKKSSIQILVPYNIQSPLVTKNYSFKKWSRDSSYNKLMVVLFL